MDEALLIQCMSEGLATLRFYAWTEPAATFGYSQRYADVERLTRLRPLVRRPTGGGLVPHDRDWTYSLAVPPGTDWYELAAVDSYRRIHSWLVDSLRALGLETELAPCCRKEQPGQCFVGHEQFDVLWCGKKIAGAAQRRNRLGLLIQGSLQPPPRIARAAWESAMVNAAPREYFDFPVPQEGLPDAIRPPASAALRGLADQLAAERYSRREYNAKR